MKKSIKSNIYETALADTWSLFEGHLSGEREGLVCILSKEPLSAEATKALQNSFAKLGYGNNACTFLTLKNTVLPGEAPELEEQSLRTAIEGLDPLLLVVTDSTAAQACEQAYKQPLPLDKRGRLLARETRAFTSFENLLEDTPGKQKAWALLKSLPRLNN